LSISSALKFQLNRFFISLKIKKNRYRWFVISTDLNQGKAVLLPKNCKMNYSQWKICKRDEKDLNTLISTINEFLDISENSDEYKTFVANHYKNQGYTVWEYSKEKNLKNSDKLNLVLKRNRDIILVECKNNKVNISVEDIHDFEFQSSKFLETNMLFKNYNVKLRYTMAGLFLEESAFEYIQENNSRIDYDIIKIKRDPHYKV